MRRCWDGCKEIVCERSKVLVLVRHLVALDRVQLVMTNCMNPVYDSPANPRATCVETFPRRLLPTILSQSIYNSILLDPAAVIDVMESNVTH